MGTTQQVTLTATNFHEKHGAERQENSRDLRQTRGARNEDLNLIRNEKINTFVVRGMKGKGTVRGL